MGDRQLGSSQSPDREHKLGQPTGNQSGDIRAVEPLPDQGRPPDPGPHGNHGNQRRPLKDLLKVWAGQKHSWVIHGVRVGGSAAGSQQGVPGRGPRTGSSRFRLLHGPPGTPRDPQGPVAGQVLAGLIHRSRSDDIFRAEPPAGPQTRSRVPGGSCVRVTFQPWENVHPATFTCW